MTDYVTLRESGEIDIRNGMKYELYQVKRVTSTSSRTWVLDNQPFQDALTLAVRGLANREYWSTAFEHASHDTRTSILIGGVSSWAEFEQKSGPIQIMFGGSPDYSLLKVVPLLGGPAGLAQVCRCVFPVGWSGPLFKMGGEFNIKINAARGIRWDKASLAGVIAHEMLHQVGYNHRVDSYQDNSFITVFGDLVTNDGKFIARSGGLRLGSDTIPLCGAS